MENMPHLSSIPSPPSQKRYIDPPLDCAYKGVATPL